MTAGARGSAARRAARTPRGRFTALVVLAGLTGAAGVPCPATAQQLPLRQIEALAADGDYRGARHALDRWLDAPPPAEATQRPRALMLRAGLFEDPREAERLYLTVALDHPLSDEAPRALLHLGQGLLATGEAARAAAYLERLTADYPGSPHRQAGRLWLARSYRALGRPADACALGRALLQETPPAAESLPLVQHETELACRNLPAPAQAAAPAAPTTQAVTPTTRPAATPATVPAAPPATVPAAPPATVPAAPGATRPAAETGAGRFAVQAGAFRQAEGAEALAAGLRLAGYDPRLVLVPGSTLIRVRVGRFAVQAAAAALVRELESRGFAALLVTDAERERAR
jgi:cell division septation protein DedD